MVRIILLCFVLSGCSTLGEIEGTGEFGEVLRALESSRIRLGGTPNPSPEAAVINRKVGEARQIDDKTSIPHKIQSVIYILER
jgi:hypothetical protein